MRITRLGLTDVKRHARLDIRPAAGLTIVRGPNEAGKSTVHEALEMVLFRKADANREDVRSIHRWGTEAHPEIVLEFEVDGRQGRLLKRFAGPRAEAELTLDGQTTRDFAFIQEEVAAITGIPNEAFFRATAAFSGRPLRKKTPPSTRSTSGDFGFASAASRRRVSARS